MSQQTIIDRVRLELRDKQISFEATATGDSNFTVFDLPVPNVRASDLVVMVDAVVLTIVTDYTVEEAEGVVRFTVAPTNGDSIYVGGYHYAAFTDTEISTFVSTAFGQHTHGRVNEFDVAWTYTDLPAVEEYLVAVLAVIQGLWVLATDESRDVDILVPDGVTIPENQRFQKVLTLIQARTAEYDDLAMKLGVGLGRIQQSDLRRVSLQTGRLIPLYKPREYDERSLPFKPTAAAVGATVHIYGKNFTGATSVKFNTTTAVTMAVLSDTHITAVVPVGATSGPISVVTPAGTSITSQVFTVGADTATFHQGPDRILPPIDPFLQS